MCLSVLATPLAGIKFKQYLNLSNDQALDRIQFFFNSVENSKWLTSSNHNICSEELFNPYPATSFVLKMSHTFFTSAADIQVHFKLDFFM